MTAEKVCSYLGETIIHATQATSVRINQEDYPGTPVPFDGPAGCIPESTTDWEHDLEHEGRGIIAKFEGRARFETFVRGELHDNEDAQRCGPTLYIVKFLASGGLGALPGRVHYMIRNNNGRNRCCSLYLSTRDLLVQPGDRYEVWTYRDGVNGRVDSKPFDCYFEAARFRELHIQTW